MRERSIYVNKHKFNFLKTLKKRKERSVTFLMLEAIQNYFKNK